MKTIFQKLLQNEWFMLLMNATIAQTALFAMIMATLQIPPESILNSGLDQVILVFEDMP